MMRSPEEDRELAILQWSPDFADRSTAALSATRLATPWRGINYACNAAINAELDMLSEQRAIARAATLEMPALMIHGGLDPRPVSAGDSLYRALPHVHRIVLRSAGHLPWVEQPALFRRTVLDYVEGALPVAERTAETHTEAYLNG